MDAILAQGDTVVSLIGKLWDIITGNPVLSMFVFCGLMIAAVGVFASIKGTSHF